MLKRLINPFGLSITPWWLSTSISQIFYSQCFHVGLLCCKYGL